MPSSETQGSQKPLPIPRQYDPATQRKAEGILLVTTLIWGGTFGATKVLLDSGMGTLNVLTWRFGLASLIFFLVFRRKLNGLFHAHTLRHGLILGVLLYLGFSLQTAGLGETSSSRSGFITALYVIFTPLLQTLFSRKAPTLRVVLSVVIVMLGLWGLTAPGDSLSGLLDPWKTGGFNLGDLLTLACAISFAAYIVVLDHISSDDSAIPLTGIQLSTVAILSIIHRPFVEEWSMPNDVTVWGLTLYLAIFASVLSTYWQTRYQWKTTPSRAAIIFTMEAVFAALIGIFLLGEELGLIGIIGGGLILFGLILVELGGKSTKRAEESPSPTS